MDEILKPEDLPMLNDALRRGRDVEVQRTKDGIRIIEKKVRVLDKRIDRDMLKTNLAT